MSTLRASKVPGSTAVPGAVSKARKNPGEPARTIDCSGSQTTPCATVRFGSGRKPITPTIKARQASAVPQTRPPRSRVSGTAASAFSALPTGTTVIMTTAQIASSTPKKKNWVPMKMAMASAMNTR